MKQVYSDVTNMPLNAVGYVFHEVLGFKVKGEKAYAIVGETE